MTIAIEISKEIETLAWQIVKDQFGADAKKQHMFLVAEHIQKFMNTKKPNIVSYLMEGYHTSLRKFCDSDESSTAWKAIKALPDHDMKIIYDVLLEYLP